MLPEYRWTWTEPAEQVWTHVPSVLRQWHRGKNLGLDLARLEIDGDPVRVRDLDKLNLWISANGAWNCSLLSWIESERVVASVLQYGGLTQIGNAGGGRWPSGATVEQIATAEH